MTPPEKVIVVLERDDFESLVDTYDAAIDGMFQEGYALVSQEAGDGAEKADRELVVRCRAALDTDRDELIERVARALAVRTFGAAVAAEVESSRRPAWQTLRLDAEAVLAEIEGEGETDE